VRLTDGLITNERYRGEPTTDDEGKAQWPACILWDDEIQGFGVRIYPPVRGRPSRKDFIVSWKIGLRTRMMAIGTYGVDCTLRQARRAARDAIDLARRGQDPIEARQRALGIGTAEDLASRFLFEHTAAKKKPIPGGEPAPATDGEAVPPAAPADPQSQQPAVVAAPDESAPTEASSPQPAAPTNEPQPALDAATTSSPESADADGEPAVPVASPVAPAAEDVSSVAAELPEEMTPVAVVAPSIDAGPAPTAVEPPATPAGSAPPLTVSAGAPKIDARLKPPAAAPAPPKRGPTKVRLLPVPDYLYRTIEHGARESGMTIAAYLNALIEIARAAVGEVAGGRAGLSDAESSGNENGPSIGELFARVQEAQTVEVGSSSIGDDDAERKGQSD
jgi:hypothetical protein